MTQIKICGITRNEDAALAIALGADFLGFIFVPESPRYVGPEDAPQTDGVKRVGVFRNAPLAVMQKAVRAAQLDYVQLHGDESDDVVRALEVPVIRAIPVAGTVPHIESSAQWLLFDHASGGGRGKTFDWHVLRGYARTKPFLLAGGLTPDNVAEAIAIARPDAVDVSSGVESAAGIKDRMKLTTFFERVRSA